MLLDFGAARRVIGDKSQTLTAILKPAYAPIEQYAEAGSVKQGPWTDLYALGATLHYLLLNRPPPPATTRAVQDEASALTVQALPGCSENFLHIVDWMLAPRPADRPQGVAELRAALEGRTQPPRRRAPVAESAWDRTQILPAAAAVAAQPAHPAQAPQTAQTADDATVVVPKKRAVSVATPAVSARSSPPVSAVPAATAASLTQVRGKALPIGIGATALVVLAAAALWLWPKPAATPAADAQVAMATPSATLPAAPSVTTPSTPPVAATTTPATTPAAAPELALVPVVVAQPAVVEPARTAPPAASKPAPTRANPPPPRVQAPGLNVQSTTAPPADEAPRTQLQAYPATQPSPALAPPPADATAQAAAPLNPEALCGARNPLRYFVCMERECLRSRWSTHADCLKWRKEARRE